MPASCPVAETVSVSLPGVPFTVADSQSWFVDAPTDASGSPVLRSATLNAQIFAESSPKVPVLGIPEITGWFADPTVSWKVCDVEVARSVPARFVTVTSTFAVPELFVVGVRSNSHISVFVTRSVPHVSLDVSQVIGFPCVSVSVAAAVRLSALPSAMEAVKSTLSVVFSPTAWLPVRSLTTGE